MKSKISLISVILFTSLLHSQQDIRIISSDFNSLTIEYSPFYVDTSLRKFDSGEFRNIEMLYGVIANEEIWGLPAVPQRKLSIGVPSEFGNTVEVISSLYKEIPGSIIPIPFAPADSQMFSYEYKRGTEYFSYKSPEDLISFGDFGLLRGVNTQILNINPVKFDASSNRIRLYSKIVFRINFSNGAFTGKPINDDLLKGSLINYYVARNWSAEKVALKKTTVTNSVLATGRWVRFETPEEGFYKILKTSLAQYGIDPNNVDPRTIKIYNNGGKVLSEIITVVRPNDLVENAITVVGESDGKFDDNDYIYFYARGSSFFDYDFDGKTIRRFNNIYSSKNYYWITSGGELGKRITEQPSLTDAPLVIQASTTAFASWEEDKINIAKSGRIFLGDDFNQAASSRTYINKLDGRIDSEPIKYNFRFVVGSSSSLGLAVTENGTPLISQNLSGYGSTLYTVGVPYDRNMVFNGALPDNRSALNFKISPSSVTSLAYLDYFTIEYKKVLTAFNDNLLFFSDEINGIVEYDLNGYTSSNIKVFNITNYDDVKIITGTNLSGSEAKFRANESAIQRSKYFAIGSDNFKTPINPAEIQNSNLRGEQQGAKFVIITHKNFKDAANNLKSYRENQAPVNISTTVIDVDEIYNEFSCGVIDPSAVRDYIKYAFDNWQIKPEYVLFFGKGTYDYKNVEGFGDNFIPTWQSIESLALINSYTTDDFFVRVSGTDVLVDLALGRITCRSLEEANAIVSKIITYEKDQQKGSWRNLITLVADDGKTSTNPNEGSEHTAPSERIATVYLPKSFDINKIYSAAYPDVITGQGRRKPEVNQAIIDAINQGTLLVNYIGHGSPELWAHEVIFEKSVTLPQLKNDKYFFLTAATCDFGYFDIPNFQSAAEAMMFLPNSGSIAAFTAARLVYSGINHQLNYDLVQTLFSSPRDTMNLSIPVGLATFLTKQRRNSINDQKYNIFGDPTLRLLVPQYSADIDSINGQSLTSSVQIKALSRTKIDGEVLKPDNTPWTDFNGEGVLTFFDSERTVLLSSINNYPMIVQGGIIFNGRVSINNGKFSSDFVIPKDISYENKNGKIIFYFFDSSVDGLGYTDNVIVGGTDSTSVNDGKGPEIEIHFDEVSYNNAYLVGPNPNLIVKLFDETGLNTTGTGVGHKLEGILNQQNNNPIDFTNYFVGDLDAGGKAGQINYKFSNLNSGEYQIDLKAWDVFNNFSSEKAFFSVVEGDGLVVRDVYNYPNPFSSNTSFTFQQNLSQPIDVKIKVYTIAGRMIREIERQNINEKFVTIDWDGRDQDGDEIANGTYLYKIIIKTIDGEFSKSVLGKLAVIR